MSRRTFYRFIIPTLLAAGFFVFGGAALAAEAPAHLWHFDDCEGNILKDSAGVEDLPQNAIWVPGKWGCAVNQSWQARYDIEKTFNSPLPAGALTLSLYWRNSSFPNEGRNHLSLKTASGGVVAGIRPSIYSYGLYYDGGATTTIPAMPEDADWHLITITYGPSQMTYYLDGAARAVFPGDFTIKSPITSLEIKGENFPVEMDELAVWSRALTAEEATNIYNSQAPIEPYTPWPVPEKAKIIHLWHFDEGAGTTTADSAGATTLAQNAWWRAGKFGGGIEQSWQSQYQIVQSLPPIDSKDISLDFWWRNSSYPNEGRGSLILQTSEGLNVFGLRPSYISGGYFFNGSLNGLGDSLPHDNLWHHLALVYDSYHLTLSFFVDGVEKIKKPNTWFRRPVAKLVIQGENWPYEIDELAVWQGALSGQEIKNYYDSGKPHGAAPEPVIIVPGVMGSWNVSGEWELDPILHTYDNLWQAFKKAGYEEDKTLFAFPYQWRQDNIITAYKLKQKIDEIKSTCNCDKVDIVAHSMGGLVARYYAESDYYENDIDQLVFLGVPHRGAPKSYLTWEGAEGFDSPQEKLAKLYLEVEAHLMGYSSLFNYIQGHVKSVKQLLPAYAYLQDMDKVDFRIYDSVSYPNNYPYNIFLENINSADKMVQFFNSGIKIMNFIGDMGDNTTGAIKVSSGLQYLPMWQHGRKIETVNLAGDDTVPEISSSLFIPTKINNSSHNSLPSKAQKQIIQYLTNNLPVYEITDIKEPKKIMVVRIFSPVDFVIVAPNGQKLGKDFLSGQTVNEIPSAFYSGFDSDAEFAVIPDPIDGLYKIELQGTGQGEYKLSASLVSDSQQIDREFTGDTSPSVQKDFNITYTAAAEDLLSELEPIDTAPPVVIINKPVADEKYLHNDDLAFNYTATDDFSGIATTTIAIDSQRITATTIDLFDYSLGEHNLTIRVIDKAGNQAQAKVNFEVVANIDSTISDIEETHNRGWLKGRLYHPLLIGAFRLLEIEIKFIDKEKGLTEKLIEKTQDNPKLSDKQKQKLIEQYNKKLEDLKKSRDKEISHGLDLITKLLNTARKQNQINQAGYDIIISNINYLRKNL